MNKCRSLTLQVGRIRLDSESQATSLGQLFMRRSLAATTGDSSTAAMTALGKKLTEQDL